MTGRSRARDRSRPSGGAPPWTPARLSSLAAWYRADLGVTLNGGNVSAWADQSGNGRHSAQGTAANQPALVTSDAAYNNRSTLSFDGGDWLDALAAWTLTQPVTIYVVGQTGLSADYKTFVDAYAGARMIVRADGSEALSMFAGTGNIEPGASVASASIVCSVFNGASSAGYVSNVSSSVTGNPGSGGLGTPRIGAAPTGIYPLASGGKIAELVFVSAAHDATQRAQLFSYFSRRYAIAVTGL
jgi:hypothetical protein